MVRQYINFINSNLKTIISKNLKTVNSFLISLLAIFLLNPNIGLYTFNFSHICIYSLSFLLFIALVYSLYKTKFKIDVLGAAISLIVLFLSTSFNRPYNLLNGPIIKGEIILFTLICFFLIISKKENLIYKFLTLSPIILLSIFLFDGTKGIVWSDDNPTFLYRLEALKRFFPNIPFYFTGWNAGLDARDFFATGALNIFFLAYPLIKFLDLSIHYNIILGYLLFIILPLCIFITCKILKKDFKFISIAITLGVTNSLFWYRWALKYGTLGFITSSCLAPLVFILSTKLLSKDEVLSRNEAILFVISTTLLLLWSGLGLAFIPCIIFALIFIKRVFNKKYSIKILLSLILINLPWIMIFWSASNVSNFIKSEKSVESSAQASKSQNISSSSSVNNDNNLKKDFKTKVRKISLSKSLKNYRETFVATNPLIYVFIIPSLFLLNRSYKFLYIATSLWLLFLGTVFAEVKPQMEFDRMLIVLGILSIIPCTESMSSILKSNNSIFRNIIKAFICSFLIVGIFATAGILRNRSLETYYHQNENIKELLKFIKETDVSGRILFAGFVLHDFGNGHIAPFPFLTGKQFIASSPFHNVWKYTDVIPREFLSNDKIIKDKLLEKYLKLQNVELIIAHDRNSKEYFLKNSNFKEIFSIDKFKIFKYLKFNNSFLLSGNTNNIKIYENKISLTPISKEIILKFNYYPFLQSSNCKITNFRASDSLNFIKLYDCNVYENVTIKSKNAFLRVLKK